MDTNNLIMLGRYATNGVITVTSSTLRRLLFEYSSGTTAEANERTYRWRCGRPTVATVLCKQKSNRTETMYSRAKMKRCLGKENLFMGGN